jgi:hypothetical protein
VRAITSICWSLVSLLKCTASAAAAGKQNKQSVTAHTTHTVIICRAEQDAKHEQVSSTSTRRPAKQHAVYSIRWLTAVRTTLYKYSLLVLLTATDADGEAGVLLRVLHSIHQHLPASFIQGKARPATAATQARCQHL